MRNVLITGGAMGIGKAIAQIFIENGDHVIVFDIKKPDYEVEYYNVDIRDEKQIEEAFKHIDKLDVLVNNAGVYLQRDCDETSKEELDWIVDTNLKGTYLITKHALPLIKKNRGNIINISSGLGVVPEPESPAYCSTKAAIIMFTKCLAQRYASIGVRVNAVLPGPIDTQLLRSAFKSQKELEDYAKLNPMKRIGSPKDVANVVFFLASDKARYITGGLYSVDGGESSSSIYSK